MLARCGAMCGAKHCDGAMTSRNPESSRVANAASSNVVSVVSRLPGRRRLATVRLKRQVEGVAVLVDLLFASSGIEPEIAAAAEQLEIFPGLVLPVARTGHLIALKLLARDDETRPQDLVDLNGLLETAVPADISEARDAVRLITERGFNRDRNLSAALEQLLSR